MRMTMIAKLSSGALLGAMLVLPVLAADAAGQSALPGKEEACLQNNRIWGWQAVDERTLLVTDVSYRRYTVHLTGGCVGLKTYATATMIFAPKTSLGCLSQGDRVSFDSPGLGPMSCTVIKVDAGTPSAPPAK